MKPADDFHALSDDLAIWEAYDPSSKVDLSATALAVNGTGADEARQLILIDPIPLRAEAWAELLQTLRTPAPAAVLLTSGNHARAAVDFRRRFGIPIYAHADAREELAFPPGEEIISLTDGTIFDGALHVIPLPGFAAGEVAFYHPANGGLMLMGDALLNLPEPYGFCLLPDKYCLDPKLARQSLRRLLEHDFARMTFAHGTPLLSGARERLLELIGHGG